MKAADFVTRLQKVRASGNSWTALCPGHSDTNRSLSIAEKDGKILLNCHAGCPTANIVGQLGLSMSDLFDSPAKSNGIHVQPPKSSARSIGTIYQYTDADGNLVFENVRYSDKTFRQRRPDGKGGYIWNLTGIDPVPYRLPELIAASKTNEPTIWLTEGEKDADSLRSLGLTASNFKKWDSAFNCYLKTAHVAILCDHDTPGLSQAKQAARLIDGNCFSLKVIDLFDGDPLPANHGKDVSDYISEGRAEGQDDAAIAERLCLILDGTSAWTDAGSPDTSQLGYTFGELDALQLDPRDEVISGLARGENGLLNAITNAGKTTLIRNVSLALVTGRAWEPLVKAGPPRRVAIIDGEDTLTFLRSDIRKMTDGFSDAEKNLVRDNLLLFADTEIDGDELRINKTEHFDLLTQRLKAFAPDLACIDTISSCFVIHNENDNAEVKERVMKPLKRLARAVDTATLAAHHIGKAKLEEGSTRELSHRGRGASSFGDQSRLILDLDKDSVTDNVILSCAKLKGSKFTDTIFKLDTSTRWLQNIGEHKKPSSYELVIQSFEAGKEYSTADIVKDLDGEVAERTVKRLLSEGVRRDDLRKVKTGVYELQVKP